MVSTGATAPVPVAFNSGPRDVPPAYNDGDPTTLTTQVWTSGSGAFNLSFDVRGGPSFEVWTTLEGLEAIAGTCLAAIVSAAREAVAA